MNLRRFLLAGLVSAVVVLPSWAADFTLTPASAPATVTLDNKFTSPTTRSIVQLRTVAGNINVELLAEDAPKTVENFLRYVRADRYSNTIIHRAIPFNIVQGGGYFSYYPVSQTTHIPTFDPIALEYKVANTRGTVAMARTSEQNSATSEWFVNLTDNSTTFGPANGGGYAVFARVLGGGLGILEEVAQLPRTAYAVTPTSDGASFPLYGLDITTNQTIELTNQNLVAVREAKEVTVFPTSETDTLHAYRYRAVAANPEVVLAEVRGNRLYLTPGRTPGVTTVTITADDGTSAGALAVASGAKVTYEVENTFAITRQPASLRVAAGASATFSVRAEALSGALSYQWRRDGQPIDGATADAYTVPAATTADAGRYDVVVTHAAGTATSRPATLAVGAGAPGRIVNFSVRGPAGPGVNSLIGGLILGDGADLDLLVRGLGPQLSLLGLGGTLADPRVRLTQIFPNSREVVRNDNWGTPAEQVAALQAAFATAFTSPLASTTSLDAAMLATLSSAGGYTAVLEGRSISRGTALLEFFDVSEDSAARLLTNFSGRGPVGTGDNVLVLGFILTGDSPRQILVRGRGPSLAASGLTGLLADPELVLHRLTFPGSEIIARSDDWKQGSAATVAEIAASFAPAGAGRPEDLALEAREAAILVTLWPGAYTATLRGKGDTAGLGLLEFFLLP